MLLDMSQGNVIEAQLSHGFTTSGAAATVQKCKI